MAASVQLLRSAPEPSVDAEAVYLDANATTQASCAVVDAVVETMTLGPLNASSAHGGGSLARDILASAKDNVALLVDGCFPEGIVLTSGATEANNLALSPAHLDAGTTLLVSAVEHASVLRPAEAARARGADVRVVPVDRDGLLDLDALRTCVESARERLLVSVQWANGETGVLQPVAEVARTIRARRPAFVHTDAVQAVGRVRVDIAEAGVDALSLTAHKLHGPQGIGALVLADAEEPDPRPSLYGGDQQGGRRPGTEPVHLAAGFGVAARERALGLVHIAAKLAALRRLFESCVQEMMSDVVINGSVVARVPNTSNMRFPDVDGSLLVARLDDAGVRCSQGSACASGRPQPSHVLLAMGMTERQAQASVRFSFSVMNSEDQVSRAAETVVRTAKALQGRHQW